jgi:hypothetical protein
MEIEISCKLTTHVNRVSEEVASVSDQENQATFNFWVSPYVRELQQKTGSNPNHKSDRQTAKEDQHEDANGLEETQDRQFTSVRARLVLLRRLEQYNGDSIVQDRFSKDNGVKLRVNFVRVEDRQNSYRVRSTQSCADAHSFDETDVQTFKGNARPEP